MLNKKLTIDQVKEMFSKVKDPQKKSIVYFGHSFTKDDGLFIYKDYFERILNVNNHQDILKLKPDWEILARREATLRREYYSVKRPQSA